MQGRRRLKEQSNDFGPPYRALSVSRRLYWIKRVPGRAATKIAHAGEKRELEHGGARAHGAILRRGGMSPVVGGGDPELKKHCLQSGWCSNTDAWCILKKRGARSDLIPGGT